MDLSVQEKSEKYKILNFTRLEKIKAFIKDLLLPAVPVHVFDKEKTINKAKCLDP